MHTYFAGRSPLAPPHPLPRSGVMRSYTSTDRNQNHGCDTLRVSFRVGQR